MTNSRLGVDALLRRRESKTGVLPWYRQAKETKCGGKAGRKSQCLDSTEEAGERAPARTPWREARHRDMDSLLGDTANAWKFE